MSDDKKCLYSKAEFAPYGDGSGFKINIVIEQAEDSEPTITLDDVFRVSASEWIAAARKIEHMLDCIPRPDRKQP
jgi:hypothetical protein